MITVTEKARGILLTNILDAKALGAPDNWGLRVVTKGGGCSGFQYGMFLDEHKGDDIVQEVEGFNIYTDPISAPLVEGMVIDYKDDIDGVGFTFGNPNAKSSCGCGKSFDI